MQINLGSVQSTKSIKKELYDMIVIGSGPAGLNASLYGARKGLDVLLIGLLSGGQLLNTSIVDNYLGFQSISGFDLAQEYLKHVQNEEIEFQQFSQVEQIRKVNNLFVLTLLDGTTVEGRTVILATGGTPRKLGLKNEEFFANKGLSYCAICDAPLFKNKEVAVVGGGNSALEAAIDLSKIVKQVHLIHRSQFRADPPLISKLKELDNVTIHLRHEVAELKGENFLTGLVVQSNETDELFEIDVDGLFIEIGVIPNSALVKDLVDLNEFDEVIVDENKQTSLPGLFAAGDVTESYKQIIVAASDGAIAALAANLYLNKMEENGNGKDVYNRDY